LDGTNCRADIASPSFNCFFFLRNEKQNITLQASLDNVVHFGGNSVTISSGGRVYINTAFEKYQMNKHLPDLIIQKIVIGEKYYMWDGSLILECPSNGYRSDIYFSEKNETTNMIKGQITQYGKVLFEIIGCAGKVSYYWKPEEGKKGKKELYKFLSNSLLNQNISYPPPESRVKLNSLRIWKDVSNAIIKNDMVSADDFKKKIEHEQRVRAKKRELSGVPYMPYYFDTKIINEHTVYEPKKFVKINQQHINDLKERVLKQSQEQEEEINIEDLKITSERDIPTKSSIFSISKESKKNKLSSKESLKENSTSSREKTPNDEENCVIS